MGSVAQERKKKNRSLDVGFLGIEASKLNIKANLLIDNFRGNYIKINLSLKVFKLAIFH